MFVYIYLNYIYMYEECCPLMESLPEIPQNLNIEITL